MKPMYPMFDHSLLFSANSKVVLPCWLPVKVFVEAKDFSPPAAEGGEEGAVEMFCAWLRKAVEASLETCKKNNSTGFLKLFSMSEIQREKVHEGVVEDVAWHLRHKYLFGSVGDDRYLYIWDLRTPSVTKPIQSVVAHQSEMDVSGVTNIGSNTIDIDNDIEIDDDPTLGNNEEDEPKKPREKRENSSFVWDHFTRIPTPKVPPPGYKQKATCNYCGTEFGCNSDHNGTSSMRTHLIRRLVLEANLEELCVTEEGLENETVNCEVCWNQMLCYWKVCCNDFWFNFLLLFGLM
ncbi:hypothetical protein RHMOL_Rhmol10G0151300 [Rhododendron molle]|uniref:Uncharacterized protein n=1 Tax=Rhododendron molle TaxID=49168 RepID=A0ACC0M266_RHOML|nr:hypothetical protein RHMOL_Rhmol10G0151300 [Rhododendron molle]